MAKTIAGSYSSETKPPVHQTTLGVLEVRILPHDNFSAKVVPLRGRGLRKMPIRIRESQALALFLCYFAPSYRSMNNLRERPE